MSPESAPILSSHRREAADSSHRREAADSSHRREAADSRGLRTACSLGVEIPGGRAAVIVPKGSTPPRSDARVFTTVVDSQRAVEVRVVACRGADRGGPRPVSPPLVRFLLAGIRRGARGRARIQIGLALEESGMVRAWAMELGGTAREEVFFPGIPAVYPSGVSGDTLALLADRLCGEEPARRPGGKRRVRDEAAEIRRWLESPGPWPSPKKAAEGTAVALQTLAGEIASARRYSSTAGPHVVGEARNGH